MARVKVVKLNFSALAEYRKAQGMNQHDFWQRFGVTQSGGSRYESGRDTPTATAMLMWLLDTEKLTEKDLAAALKAVSKR